MTTFFRAIRSMSAFAAAALVVSLAPAAHADDPQAGLYKVKLSANVARGAKQKIEIEITPSSGYKWNKDYPAKLQLKNGKKLEFAKTSFSKAEGDISGDEKGGKVVLMATAKEAGTETVEATVSFSLCNAETCQVLRQRPLPIPVTIK